jgi:5-methylcytosine-specific restriction endonuclease McrA
MTDNDADKVSRTDVTPWRDEQTLRHFYHGKGYSLLETAEATGCTEGTVSQWCNRLGVETRDAQAARDHGTPEELENPEWLREEYRVKERTCEEIGDDLGVTTRTVSNWLRRHDIPTRGRHRRRNRVTLTCENCGSDFERVASQEDNAKYCSRECYYDAQEIPTGSDHWSWRETPEYRPSGEEWESLRSRIRERDGHECQLCGVHESDMERTLDVHHLDRVRDADDPRAAVNVDESRLVALCRSCHRRAEPFAPLLPPALQ